MALSLAVELQADREVLLEDVALARELSDARLRIEENHIICGKGAGQLKLLFDTSVLVHDFSEVGHCEDELNRIVFVILSDFFNLILLSKLFQEFLEVTRPLFDRQFRDLQPIWQFHAISARE